ncbi:MAG TPA: VOC family protein [Candidatus Binatus sp.]|nr:VOC family protein [Candidatus Binatus sp.]
MPKTPSEGSPNIFPALRYRDGAAAVDWLARAFGFEKQMVVPGPDGTIAHAQLSLGPGVIMLGSAGDEQDKNPWAAVKQGIYVYVKDVDAHYRRAKASGADIVRELQDTDYGAREYSVRDPEGHLWSFGTYYPGA